MNARSLEGAARGATIGKAVVQMKALADRVALHGREWRECIGDGTLALGPAFGQACADLDAIHAELTRLSALLVGSDAELHFYADLFVEAPGILIVTTRRGIVRDANDAAALALHVPRSFLRDKPLVGFVARNACAAFRDFLGCACRDVSTADVTLRARHGGGLFAANLCLRMSKGGYLLWGVHPVVEARAAATSASA